MKRIFPAVKTHASALLLFLYIFSFWLSPQGWNEDNPLDGSWRYALGKFRELGLSLGKDSWFTYGPLAHWFGAPMGTEQYQPFLYYLAGLFVAGIIGITFTRILGATGLSFRSRLISTLIFPLCFIGMDGVQEVHLVIAVLLLLVSCCLQETADNVSIISLVFLSACGVLYKISFGILSLFMLVVLLASLFAGRKIGGRETLLYLAGYVAILYVLFVGTSASFDLFTYIRLGLETSGKYSEIMIRNMPYSPPNYIVALLYGTAGSVLAWQASKKMAGRAATLCLIAAYLGSMLMLFKHGFVRADLSHMKLFYGCVTPFLAILAMVSFSGYGTKAAAEKVSLCSAFMVFLVIFAVMLKFLPGETGPKTVLKNWLTCGHRIVAGIKGQSPEEFPSKRVFVKNSQPQLFSFLNDHARTFAGKGRKPRIAFYPWELLYFEGVEGYDLAPSPSLQIYSAGPHSRAHRLEAEFLSSSRRPDVVVIGPGAIDDRSPVSELTDLLPPLYSHYRVSAVVEGFTILEAKETIKSPDTVIRITEKPQEIPGEFLRISFDQPGVVNRLIWRLATTLFKSPELHVVVTMTHADNERREYVWRGYLSQLQSGIFYSPDDIPEFFRSSFGASVKMPASSPQYSSVIKNATAELRRSGGFWNLPVFPRAVPLKIQYCSFN